MSFQQQLRNAHRTSSEFLKVGYSVIVLNFAESVRMPYFVPRCPKKLTTTSIQFSESRHIENHSSSASSENFLKTL